MKSSIKERFKFTKSGKVMRRPSGFNHLRAKKSGYAKQRGRKQIELGSKFNINA